MGRNGPSKDEVVQGQRFQRSLRHPWTFDGLIDGFGRGIDRVGIITSGPGVLDVVLRLELLETFGASIVALGARGPGNQQKHLEYIAGSG